MRLLIFSVLLFSTTASAQLIEMGVELKNNYNQTMTSSENCKKVSPNAASISVVDKNLSTKTHIVAISLLNQMLSYGHQESQTSQTAVVMIDFYTAFISYVLNEEMVGMQPCNNDRKENKKACLKAVSLVQKDMEQIQSSIKQNYKNGSLSAKDNEAQNAYVGCFNDLMDVYETTVKKF